MIFQPWLQYRYVSAPTRFCGVTLPPVQLSSVINWAVSGWLNFMKSITSSRILSCIVSSIELGVGDKVGLIELVGVGDVEGVKVGVVDGINVGVDTEDEGSAEVGV